MRRARSFLSFLGLLGLGLACFLFWATRTPAQPFQLGLPIDCSATDHCFVLLYPDRDPGPEAVDFNCGRLTNDGHKGTDFAIPDAKTMERGVPVVASAPGKVLRIRDGIPDRRLRSAELPPELRGKECGNGMVIDHGNGWTTQYCHLRRGSVSVRPGDRVRQGDRLGEVGLSGKTSFPHVHMQVALNKRIVDPFVGADASPGCQGDRRPLWAAPLPYVPTGAIRAGFATEKPSLGDLWDGKFSETTLSADEAPAFLFWVQTFGVLEGDIESIELLDPQGQVAARSRAPISRSRRLWLRFTGLRADKQPLAPGSWRGRYRLERNGQVLLDLERQTIVQ